MTPETTKAGEDDMATGLDREAVARIIDGVWDDYMGGPGSSFAAVIEARHAEALAKADAIIALLPAPGSSVEGGGNSSSWDQSDRGSIGAGGEVTPDGWRDIASAPRDERVLVQFVGAGPIVAYRDPDMPAMWVRYLGFGKSTYWPTIHEDYATHWRPLPAPPKAETGE